MEVLFRVGAIVLGLALFSTALLAVEPAHSGFSAPTGIAFSEDGTMYVSNWGGGTVERIATDGTRTVVARGIASPAGLAVDREGVLYIAAYSGDYVAKVSKDGAVVTVAEGFATPTGVAFASDGTLLVANRSSGEIVKLNIQTGEKRTVADGLSLPVGVIEMPDKSLVVSQYGGRVTRVMPDGVKQELGESFSRPGVGIMADSSDAVLVIDNGAGVVRRVDFQGKSSVAVDGMQGSAVALTRAPNGDIVVGTWGAGKIYRIPNK